MSSRTTTSFACIDSHCDHDYFYLEPFQAEHTGQHDMDCQNSLRCEPFESTTKSTYSYYCSKPMDNNTVAFDPLSSSPATSTLSTDTGYCSSASSSSAASGSYSSVSNLKLNTMKLSSDELISHDVLHAESDVKSQKSFRQLFDELTTALEQAVDVPRRCISNNTNQGSRVDDIDPRQMYNLLISENAHIPQQLPSVICASGSELQPDLRPAMRRELANWMLAVNAFNLIY